MTHGLVSWSRYFWDTGIREWKLVMTTDRDEAVAHGGHPDDIVSNYGREDGKQTDQARERNQ